MSKHQLQMLTILVIAAVVFSAVVFLIPFPKGAVFWIAYIAELIALALQIPILKTAYDGSNTLHSKVLGFPVARVGYLYLGIQTALSLALFPLGLIPNFPVWLAAVLCLLVLGGAIICSITADIAKEEVKQIESVQQKVTSRMMELRTASQNLVKQANDDTLRSALEKLAENIRYSDPVSSDAIFACEDALMRTFGELQDAVEAGDTEAAIAKCQGVQNVLDDRNTACKSHKQE